MTTQQELGGLNDDILTLKLTIAFLIKVLVASKNNPLLDRNM